MKKLLFVLLLIGNFSPCFSQCCPYIDGVEIIPSNPNSSQEIMAVLTVTTPNQGVFISASAEVDENIVSIEACYYSGFLTALQTYVDTVVIGNLSPGDYSYTFTAYQSSSETECVDPVNQINTGIFTVDEANAIEEVEKDVLTIFPNPSINGRIIVRTDLDIVNIEVFDQLGKVVLVLDHSILSSNHEVDLSALNKAVYFLKLYDRKGNEYVREVVLK